MSVRVKAIHEYNPIKKILIFPVAVKNFSLLGKKHVRIPEIEEDFQELHHK